MKSKGFTLVELLAVIVILAIILAIAVPSISKMIKSSTKQAFESDAKMVLKAIDYELLENDSFDYTTITEGNIKSLLNLSADNYQNLTIEKRNNKPYIIAVGKNKFDNLTVSGSSTNVVVDDGLVLWLDAGSVTSYPGTGTIWYDLSKSTSNATLVGPVYSNTNGGIFTFDGVDDYADFNAPNLGNTATIEMWCKLGTAYAGKMMFGWDSYDVWLSGGSLGYNTSNGDMYGITSGVFSAFSPDSNYFHYIFEMRTDLSYTNNKIYINGIMQTLSQLYGTERDASKTFNNGNGRIANWRKDSKYIAPMSCSTFKVYNRALNLTEIKDNYNIMKLRLGL